MKGQLSAEMMILIVVIISLIAIVAIQLLSSAKESSSNFQSQSDRLSNITSNAVRSDLDGPCLENDDCKIGLMCVRSRCVESS
ncbi:hypothetical protein HY990_04020 [Candidatus Micrarchaeota archaeon]|nr:hypothetical protein [Candidatus Micrarchaeota archaeon]